MNFYNFEKIFSKFDIDARYFGVERFGNGHINETFLITCINNDNNKERKIILQKINSKLFNVEKLMSNIGLVSDFVVKKLQSEGKDPDKLSLRLFFTKDNKPYYYDADSRGYFRAFNYIENSIAYEKIDSPQIFYQTARAFGDFAKILAEFDAEKLYEILPNFHNTKKRFRNFENSLNSDRFNRAKDVSREINFVVERKKYCSKIVNLLDSHRMPLRVTHNDTKLNNVLFDKDSGEYLTVIDLDTIMSGSICYDFGDAIRFGCNTSFEDEIDLSKVHFDINLFEEFTKGYLETLGDSLTEIEKDNLAFSAILMTYECGMRFLTDYLEGDSYFRTSRDGQNLDRARTQFKLITEMEKSYGKMCKIVDKYYQK